VRPSVERNPKGCRPRHHARAHAALRWCRPREDRRHPGCAGRVTPLAGVLHNEHHLVHRGPVAPHAFPPHEVASGESTNPDGEALTDLRPAMHTPGACWSRSAAPAAGGARRGTLIAATMART